MILSGNGGGIDDDLGGWCCGMSQVTAEEVWLPDASYRAGGDWPVAGSGDEEDSPCLRRPLQAGPSPAQGPEGQSYDQTPPTLSLTVFFYRLLLTFHCLIFFLLRFFILSRHSPPCFQIFFFISALSVHPFYYSYFLFHLVHTAATLNCLPFFTVILKFILKVAPVSFPHQVVFIFF